MSVRSRASVAGVLVAALGIALWAAGAQGGVSAPRTDGRIAFNSDRDGNNEIYVMSPDGTGVTRLTNEIAWDCCPAWSPDGTKIAFVSYRDGNNELYLM